MQILGGIATEVGAIGVDIEALAMQRSRSSVTLASSLVCFVLVSGVRNF